MQHIVRAAIASLVKAVTGKSNPAPIEDLSAANTIIFRGSITGSSVHVIGADDQLHLSGSLPNLYESGSQTRIFIKIDGSDFSGFSYETQTRFSGRASAGGITLFDYNAGRQFLFR